MPTEQPRKLRCLQDPPAWPGCSLAMERVAPSQAQRVTPSAVTVDERDTEDCATTKGQQPTTLHPSKGSGHRRGARRSTVAPLLPLARSPAARVFPCPPAGSNTHNTSPRPFGRAGRGFTPAEGEQPGETGVGGELANGLPISPAQRLHELATENADFLAANGWRDLVDDRRGHLALNPNVGKIPHAAAAYLDFLRHLGAPALSTDRPWTPAEVQAAADRGPHPSAEAHQDFLWEEAAKICQQRHTMVLHLSLQGSSGEYR